MIIRGGTFGPVATNTYVVADAHGGSAWVVDPAMGSAAWVAETLRRFELRPVAVLDTHGHWDHVVENHVWAENGLPVWVGAGDEDWLAAPAPFNPALFGNPPPTPGVTPERILADGDVLELGDLRFRLLATPGHSPGCMVAVEESEGVALVGDLVFAQGVGRTDFPRSDPAAMLASLQRLFDEVPRDVRIHPGHGPWGVTLGEAEPYARMFM
ncbi:MBL fold metallo-hydrolase [Miltoncostaea marina]|uniref:MBL fold metallo-hydrolase n=1 Tax=Miltoncostaea marina TaxID=2843215 RepID=UPI001C3D6D06|nr:MBL fold metallo-hydrolase [Miltoncostaea marina]